MNPWLVFALGVVVGGTLTVTGFGLLMLWNYFPHGEWGPRS